MRMLINGMLIKQEFKISSRVDIGNRKLDCFVAGVKIPAIIRTF
jgi:hypothetical protein